MDLALQSGAVTVLLGATQAGKTSLMRIMAGLDAHQGRVLVDGRDVTGCRCASATWPWSTSSSSTTRR
jgi:glycerol transport system ATP-binding protein